MKQPYEPFTMHDQLDFVLSCIHQFPIWKHGATMIAAATQPFEQFANWRNHADGIYTNPGRWVFCTRGDWISNRHARGLPVTIGEPGQVLDQHAHKNPWNPSVKAVNRVDNPLPLPEHCHYCAGKVAIVSHVELYGRDYGDWPWALRCQQCSATVGLHPFTAIPLGFLADQETKDARARYKRTFQRLYADGGMSRKRAYAALAERMGIDRGACHFGWFNAEQCEQAHEVCLEILNERHR